MKTVVELFSSVAKARPDVIAVVDGRRTITYGELNRRAIVLASEFIKRGLKKESTVGLFLDRSTELYLGMLAAHKAGCAYVPFDPSWPPKRHEFIAEETDCAVLLTIGALAHEIPSVMEGRSIILDAFDWNGDADEKLFPTPDVNRLAYILYTSGSTGTPKGVEIEHAGLSNFVSWQNNNFPYPGPFRTTQSAKPGFDASCSEIWPAFCRGNTLYVTPEEIIAAPSALAAWLTEHRIFECFLPTPLAEMLMDHGMPSDSSLKILRSGGDRLTRKPPADFPAVLINEYGPSECTIVSSSSFYSPGESETTPPDIGHPLPNYHIYIMDDDSNILPDGEIGEICIGGIGVFRGYRKRPDLDAKSLSMNPHKPGERVYNSGDLGRRKYDGRLEFIGRRDFQVKIRGLRIELGEIEEVLASRSEVKKCVASVRTSASGSRRIAAYITVNNRSPGLTDKLAELAKSSLPAYMIPSDIIVLDSIPLTTNGKVDRNALPEPEKKSDAHVEPETETEKRLARMWLKMLKCSRVGRNDNFLHLGGDSLQASILALKIGGIFDFECSAGNVFDHPTLKRMAAFIDGQSGSGLNTLPVSTGTDRSHFPATSFQTELWRLQRFNGMDNMNNIVVTLHLVGDLDASTFIHGVHRVVARHQSLRSYFEVDGTVLFQTVANSIDFDIPREDLSGRSEEERAEILGHIISEHQDHCFDLSRPPLFKSQLIKITENGYEFLFTISHLIFDGWSNALFLDELRNITISNDIPKDEPTRRDYADFAWHHQQQLTSRAFTKRLRVWQEMLKDFHKMPSLPFEHETKQTKKERLRGERLHFTIPDKFTGRLKVFAKENDTTLFAVLQGILQILLHKYTGVNDIVTGSAFANRSHGNTGDMIGLFINSLPLRHTVNAHEGFRSFIDTFKHTVNACIEYSDVPLGMILDGMNLHGEGFPIFPVSLILQNLDWPDNENGAFKITYDEHGSGIAKTDITFILEERSRELFGMIEYRTSAFTRESVLAMIRSYMDLAKSLLGAPDTALSSIPCHVPSSFGPTCFVIGDTGLVPACCEVLLAKDFHIFGVFSEDRQVLNWAEKHRIPCHPPGKEPFRSVLKRVPFDFLFSIVNSHVIPEDVISLPRKDAVNYHDAFLPRYAGLNASAWAVINREKRHGITWHSVVKEMDAGDIYIQREIPVAEDETAVQLSLKCSEACPATLEKLAQRLLENKLDRTAQDPSQRTCYAMNDRPFAGAVLDFNKRTEDISALVRGLDFGDYDNDLATPKFIHSGTVCYFKKMRTMDQEGPAAPGTVTASDGTGISVAVKNGTVRLEGLLDWSGKEYSAADIGLGENLSCNGPEREKLHREYHLASQNEMYWTRVMKRLEEPVVPLHGWEDLPTGNSRMMLEGDETDSASLFAMFFARLCNKASLYIPVRLTREASTGLPSGFLLEYLPLQVLVDPEKNSDLNLDNIKNQLEKLLAKSKCPGDILLRRKEVEYFTRFSPALEIDHEGKVYLCNCGEEQSGMLLKRFRVFKENYLKNRTRPLGNISLLSVDEFNKIVREWNNTDRAYPIDRSYAEAFSGNLPKYRELTAVISDGRNMTYGELDACSSRLAVYLRSNGASQGDVVGICARRSFELVWGLLGILKAGCAYLAFEPGQFPKESRDGMLELANVKTLLYFDPGNKPGDYPERVHVMDMEAGRSEILSCAGGSPRVDCTVDDTAYVMFTSGSTGQPKGVAVSHSNLLNHNYSVIDIFGLTSRDRMLQFGTLSFDLSVEEIFPILLAGGTLVFRPGTVPPSPVELLEHMRANYVSVADLPTAYWHEMVGNINPAELPSSLRLVIIGGEHASNDLIRKWGRIAPKIKLLNTYGPTETTIIATCTERLDTIGKPIPNTRCYILDPRMQLCPPGIPGELFIGGRSVSKGYLANPEMTFKSFVPDPFAGEDRMYKTGDMAVYSPEGDIIFLGRDDRQIKIRGFRIELGSVESALRKFSEVENAVAVANTHASTGTKVLDCYISSKNMNLDTEAIRAKLAEDLPDYMVPKSITLIRKMPITANGKIDIKALPEPRKKSPQAYRRTEPLSATEMQLTLIFERILGMENVNREESFFHMGGDSLAALNLCLEVERLCKVSLSMEELYRHPSIKGLEKVLAQQVSAESQWRSLIQLSDTGSKQPLYLIHTTPGDILGYVNLVEYLTDRPVFGFQAYGIKPGNTPHRSIREMAGYYVGEMVKNQPEGPYYLCGWCFGGLVAYEMARILASIGTEVGFLGLIETWGRPAPDFHHHLRKFLNFIRSGPQGWLAYLEVKVRNKLSGHTSGQLDFIGTRLTDTVFEDQIEHLKNLYKTNMRAAYAYRMKPYHGKVHLFMLKESDLIGMIPDPEYYWQGLIDHRKVYLLDGTHSSILKNPNVIETAEKISEALGEADL